MSNYPEGALLLTVQRVVQIALYFSHSPELPRPRRNNALEAWNRLYRLSRAERIDTCILIPSHTLIYLCSILSKVYPSSHLLFSGHLPRLTYNYDLPPICRYVYYLFAFISCKFVNFLFFQLCILLAVPSCIVPCLFFAVVYIYCCIKRFLCLGRFAPYH